MIRTRRIQSTQTPQKTLTAHPKDPTLLPRRVDAVLYPECLTIYAPAHISHHSRLQRAGRDSERPRRPSRRLLDGNHRRRQRIDRPDRPSRAPDGGPCRRRISMRIWKCLPCRHRCRRRSRHSRLPRRRLQRFPRGVDRCRTPHPRGPCRPGDWIQSPRRARAGCAVTPGPVRELARHLLDRSALRDPLYRSGPSPAMHSVRCK